MITSTRHIDKGLRFQFICGGSSRVVAVVWRLVVFGGYCDDSGGVDVVVGVAWGDEGGRDAMGCGVEGDDKVVWQRCGGGDDDGDVAVVVVENDGRRWR
ncbi:hypothetical protein Tco_0525256 [Tanacetum coccineum]